MRSFFCEQCNLEFDLDEDFEEGDSTVFCPQCKIHLAKMLPETPERLVMREKRLREARSREWKKIARLILVTLVILLADVLLLRFGNRSFFWMLIAGLMAGVPAGLWTRRITLDRTWRAGILASILALFGIAVVTAVVWRLIPPPEGSLAPLRNLTAAVIPAFLLAWWEKPS